MSAKQITAAINAALRKRYCAPAWSLLFNVSDATGFNGSRYADAIAMSVWPSRGLELHGFEVKASRSDWQKELASPAKAEEIASYCDHWWLVSNKLAAKEEEIPPAWGWIEFDDGELRTRKQSVKTEAAPMTRAFLAALLRRAGEAENSLVEAELERREKERAKAEVKREATSKQWANKELEDLRASLSAFEAASGIKIDRWDGQRVGEAVAFILKHGTTGPIMHVERILKMHEEAAERLRESLAKVKPAQEQAA